MSLSILPDVSRDTDLNSAYKGEKLPWQVNLR